MNSDAVVAFKQFMVRAANIGDNEPIEEERFEFNYLNTKGHMMVLTVEIKNRSLEMP